MYEMNSARQSLHYSLLFLFLNIRVESIAHRGIGEKTEVKQQSYELELQKM